MTTKMLALPKAVLVGDHQLIAPLPVDAPGYRAPTVAGVATGAYTAANGAAPALASSAVTVPALAPQSGFIGTVGTAAFNFDDVSRTTHTVPYPVVGAEFGGALLFEDLLVVDCVSQDQVAAVAPTTPGGWTQRGGSFHNGTAWVPKVTRFFKMAAGGETGNFTITTSVGVRMHFYVRAIRGVDPASFFDIAGPAASYGSGSQVPDPPAPAVNATSGSLAEVVVLGNVYPTGNPEFNEAEDFSPGYKVKFDNTQIARWAAAGEKIITGVGIADNPGSLGIIVDNYTAIVDVYKVKRTASASLFLIVALDDETASSTIGTVPVIPARNEIQTLISTLTAGTFTVTALGQTTAAINFNDTAATVKTRLEALTNVGAGNITATGGPLNVNPVVVEFVGARAATDHAAMTTSTGSVTVRQDQTGAAAINFFAAGTMNVPPLTTPDDYVPQLFYWGAVPGTWPAGRPINITVSDHATNHSWTAVLLVVRDLFTSGLVGDYGSGVADIAEVVAIFGSVTPTYSGSLIIAPFAKALNGATWYSTSSPTPTVSQPARYERAGQALGDAMTLDVFVGSPAAAGAAERLSSVTWAGVENYADHLLALRPRATAGSTPAEDVLANLTTASWLELANSVSELYEVYELDLSDIPTGAALTSASISFAHSSDILNPLRVTLVGIKADGTFVPALERRTRGYSTETLNSIETVQTGEWFEFVDGSVISDYTRLGALVFSTSRPASLTTHKLYWLTADVSYEPGGPIVANVQGVNAPGDSITWDYSSAAGLAQSHSRVLVVQGADWDLDVQFSDYFFTDFPTTGLGTVVLPSGTYELYDSVGNAGFGRRRPSAISVATDVTASANTALVITASNGTGGDTGQLVSGGLKIKLPITYGQIEFRAKASGDANNFLSPVVLMWPAADESRFPTSSGGSWPAGGELDMLENFSNRSTLTPVESHVHRLKPGAVPLFDASDDEALDYTWASVNGTAWHKYVFNWLPTGLYLSIDDGPFATLTEDVDWIPDWPMEMCIQLDAWANGTLSANRTMSVDYLVLRKLAVENVAKNPLDAQFGEIIYDSGKLPGATRRSLRIEDGPLGRGDCTALVRSWARLGNGVEVASRWGIDELFNTTGSPATSGAQTTKPVFNTATGAVELYVTTPAAVSRAWAVRSLDGGTYWTLVGPWDVGASIPVKLVDYDVPLGESDVRYQVSFDAGPMTETSAPVAVGSGSISTVSTSWWLRVPSTPSMNTAITVISTQDDRGFNVMVAEDVERAVVVGSPPLSRSMALTVRVHSEAERAKVDAILNSGLTMELVNILGRSWRVRLASNISEQLLRWAPLPGEVTQLRDAHELSFTLVEVSE